MIDGCRWTTGGDAARQKRGRSQRERVVVDDTVRHAADATVDPITERPTVSLTDNSNTFTVVSTCK